MHIQQMGQQHGGPAIVLIHGIGMSGQYFGPFMKELATTHRVVAFDLPGFGASPGPKQALTLDELADATTALITDLHLERPILIGHSMGCQIAARLLARRPDRAGQTILMGPTINAAERTYWRQIRRGLADDTMEAWHFNIHLVRDYWRCRPARYTATLKLMIEDPVEDYIAQAGMAQLLVLRGERDYIAPRPWCQQLVRRAGNAQLAEVPGQPHAAHYAAPKETARICREFLAAI